MPPAAAPLPPLAAGAAAPAAQEQQLEALAARLAGSRSDAGAPQASLPRVYGWISDTAGRRRVKCLLD